MDPSPATPAEGGDPIAPPPRAACRPASHAPRGRRPFERAGAYFAYLYLLRVPLGALVALLVLASGVLPGSALNSLLRGIFDLATPSLAGTATAFFFVTLAALMATTAIAVTARLILLDGDARFGAGRVPATDGVELVLRVVPLLAVSLIVAAATYESWPGVRDLLSGAHPDAADAWEIAGAGALAFGVLAGGAGFVFSMAGLHHLLERHVVGARSRGRGRLGAPPLLWPLIALARSMEDAARWVALRSPEGIIDGNTGDLLPRHAFAVHQLLASLGLYAYLFWVSRPDAVLDTGAEQPVVWGLWFGDHPVMPTLCLLMVLIMLACWALSFLTFFLDRFRVPVLLCLALYAWGVAQLPESDSFFPARRVATQRLVPPATLVEGLGGKPLVVVAAAGGGIQAAAWTARVLSGLQQELAADGIDFGQSVRLISGVSGGSVGAMFFAAAYKNGHLPRIGHGDAALDTFAPVRNAEASSLDEVAWGLTYPDLVWNLAPLLKGLYLWPPALISGRNLTSDRGMALETAWRSRLPKTSNRRLLRWRKDVLRHKRPALLLNATLVESGERLVMGTVDSPQAGDGNLADREAGPIPGGVRFAWRYPHLDLDAVTAARLSATFPYVTPATRVLDRGDRQSVFASQPHVVDGGYYDNYGIVSLVEWLRGALPSFPPGQKILLIEIRGWSDDEAETHAAGSHGWWFQVSHPLRVLFNVRGSGQLGQAALDVKFLAEVLRGRFIHVRFDYRAPDTDLHPPLSWHLTPSDAQMLRKAWKLAGDERKQVRAAMGGAAEGS